MTDRRLLGPLDWILVAILAITTALGFLWVPLDVTLPIHWGIDGRPDGFAPAPLALLLPALVAVFTVGVLGLARNARLKESWEAGRHVIAAAISMVLLLCIVLSGATLALGLGHAVDMPRLVALIVGAILIVIGNYLPKTRPNWVAGIRLPWTLRDAGNWRITHIWAGRLTMLGGLLILIAAIMNPAPPIMISIVLASAILPAIASIAISFALSRG